MGRSGKIILAGAGVGDPELLTLKAVRALQTADVVLHDALVSEAVLAMVRPDAEKIAVGKRGHGHSFLQDEINRKMVELAGMGKTVLRLKGGDPLIFSRAAEELAAARAAGIKVEIISGVTTAQVVAAQLAIPLTTRESARRLQFITGHDQNGKMPDDIDWQALADPRATTVIYMPKKTIATIAEKMLEHGLPPHTPAVAVMDVSLPSQLIIKGNIQTLPQLMAKEKLDGAVVVIVGSVADLCPRITN